MGIIVNILIEAELMEGYTIEDITQADVLCCTDSKVKHTSVIVKGKMSQSVKACIAETAMNKILMITKFTKKDLVGRRRNGDLPLCRHLYSKILKDTTLFSLKEIGTYLGGRDHTTIIHNVKTANDLLRVEDDKITTLYNGMNLKKNWWYEYTN